MLARSDDDPTASGSILGTVNIPNKLNQSFSLLGKPTIQGASVSPWTLADTLRIAGQVGFVCKGQGQGILWVYYSFNDDPFSEYYNLHCQGYAITPGFDTPFNVSAYFRGENGPTVKVVGVAPDVTSYHDIGGDLGIKCKRTGAATLQVTFAAEEGVDDRYYSFECHDQGSGG